MKLMIELDEKRFKDIQRIASIQIIRRSLTCEQIIANGIPLEEKTGHWIRQRGVYGLADTYECSVCGRTIYAGNKNDLKDYPYCHCGVKMKGE